MKIIYNVHKLLFFKIIKSNLDKKIWKNILSSYESKINIWIWGQLEYY